jgi:hypothetical protein
MSISAYSRSMGLRFLSIANLNWATRYRVREEPRLQRHIGVLIALLLGGCSSTDTPAPVYTPPSPPTRAAIIAGLGWAAKEEKITPPFEISPLRKVYLGGFGSYFVCIREVNPTSERRFVYSVFYSNDEYKGVRQSVVMEACEAQPFAQIDVPTPSPLSSPSPSPSPSPSW